MKCTPFFPVWVILCHLHPEKKNFPENEIYSGIPVTLTTCVAAFSDAVFLPMSAASAASRADPCGAKSDWDVGGWQLV